ncbi:hypothetical protein M422DRAFT_266015 [Sphaerobolus stellatus SS14]|uniref:Unplaced genomic scaffold SPHSTscaffold_155, whole genome shotgun sequence n=1 Tax=Sphaerobolus stellatus (strain SS14) TaxID=990650 RepID=A0A0C9V3X9_SPHS4|nr:hypothetical protein M422DRAFT_266015 [Sphaerobolus stellatus SS14]
MPPNSQSQQWSLYLSSSRSSPVAAATVAEFAPNAEGNSSVSARAAGFAQSCSSWNLSGASLRAVRTVGAGITRPTAINLNACIVNAFGTLRCQTNGGFSGSCTITSQVSTCNTLLTAMCGRGDGVRVPTQLDLNTCIGNTNGGLTC